MVSDFFLKEAIHFIDDLLYMMNHFSLITFMILSLSLAFNGLIMMFQVYISLSLFFVSLLSFKNL